AGPDTVNLGAIAAVSAGRVLITHGAGPDPSTTTPSPLGALVVAGGVRVIGGAVPDTILIEGNAVAIGGGVTVENGAGTSTTVVQSVQGLAVGGSVMVT